MKHGYHLFFFLMIVIASCNSLEQVVDNQSDAKNAMSDYRVTHSMAPLSKEDAVKVSLQFVASTGSRTKGGTSIEVESVCVIDDNQGTPIMYAVNYGSNDGFAIVNTSRKFFPILAFSETGHYSKDRNRSGLDVWLEGQKAMIAAAESLPLDSLREVNRSWLNYETRSCANVPTKSSGLMPFRDSAVIAWTSQGYECMTLEDASMYLAPSIYNQWCELAEEQSDPTYDYMESAVVLYYGTNSNTQFGPLLSTTWGQYEPYNEGLQTINGYYPPAGCSIAAMAQIMRYYSWPTTYSWSLMSNNSATYDTKQLYYNLGQDAQTTYTLTKSTTNINNLKNAITGNNYHYNASVAMHSYSTARSNIISGKPVFMQGEENTDAHAWVSDGAKTITTAIHLVLMVYTPDHLYSQAEDGGYYSDSESSEYLHMNWGEDGDANGWFYGDNVAFSGYLYNTLIQFNYATNRKDIVNITPNN